MGPYDVARLRFASLKLPVGRFKAACAQVPCQYMGIIPIVDRLFVSEATARGLQVHVWTVDDPGEMARLIALGVHGIMTDRPRVLKAVLDEHGLWR